MTSNKTLEQKPCDMGQMCLDCQPRGANGECPDQQPKQEPVATAFDVKIEDKALQMLDEMISPSVYDSRNPVRLFAGEGNSGYGLYISYEDYPEEGAELLAKIPPLYTEPPKRVWVGLTDEEIAEMTCHESLIRYFEAKLKELNT